MPDAFERYRRMQGKMVLLIKGEEYSVNATLNDKKEFVQLRDSIEKGKAQIGDVFDYAMKLMKKSYPNEDPQVLDDFLRENSSEFFDELMVGYGFTTREEIKKLYSEQGKEKK